MMIRFYCIGFLLFMARPSWAQTDQSSPFPRAYVGLQYGRQDYQLLVSTTSGSPRAEAGRTNARRPQLTVGYQLTPRLALQAGFAPLRETFTYGGIGTNNAGQPLIERGQSATRSLALPVLARYTFAVRPWKNLQLDMLGGTVLFWSRGKSEFTRTENGVVTTQSVVTTQVNNAFLAAGPSARYEAGRHLAGFVDWMFYKNVRSTAAYPGSNLGNKTGITNSVNLGIRYQFGYR